MNEQPDAFPPEQQAQRGHRRKTHRGRRAQKPVQQIDHMGEANTHLKNAQADPTKAGTMNHLFKALGSLKKC